MAILNYPSPLEVLKWIVIILVLGLAIYIVQNEVDRYRKRIRNLPGPIGYPVVGNLFQLRDKVTAQHYQTWAKTYGDVFQVQLGNTTAVVINSSKAAKALFLGQSHALNSRPTFYIFHGKLSKAGKSVTSIGTSPWDDSCKQRRKAAAGALIKSKVESYAQILNLESREFLKDILAECQNGEVDLDFRPAVRRFSLNLSLTLNYGTRVASVKSLDDDPLLREIIYVEAKISAFRDTSKNYANYIPLLRYWEPFASLFGLNKNPNEAADIGRRRLAYNNVLLEKLGQQVKEGRDKPCIQGAVLRDPDAANLTREELISVSLSMMAGADSNIPTLGWAILFLAHSPDIQEIAYTAIRDAGVLELPSTSYASTKVPYMGAFTKEISRYFVVLKLGIPRATYTDATWGAATIPANTLVFLNSWACNRDPEHFPDPHTFNPLRWIPSEDGSTPHAHQFAFGIGGRMCVAQHLAHNALYTVFLHLIAHFRILPAAGESRDEIHPLEGLKGKATFVGTPRGSRVKFIPRQPEELVEWLG
ncbi:putative daf-9 isoform A [Mytilinidion resinicola]|uniref:Daf-9 isoform A n=1 Tax=Mytilinidion resinicola TaxID=574789 RepID=A0A6A6YRD2_9PEZI|nr:putative daf-9 isoform A [Mytilinidion resinicola]KAF2811331.1 putative daf-9 isoform A [Mytilinidion resinicola]